MGEVSLAEVRHLCQMDAMCWTEHAGQRLIQRQISSEEVIYTLLYGSIVEQYPTDSPYGVSIGTRASVSPSSFRCACPAVRSAMAALAASAVSAGRWRRKVTASP